eukprot:6382053-Pyramimonas_sp.AAC.1
MYAQDRPAEVSACIPHDHDAASLTTVDSCLNGRENFGKVLKHFWVRRNYLLPHLLEAVRHANL